ncbi:response regulator transcription factor [Salana multivorans]
MTQPRIALAEDSALLREGLVRLLGEAGFEVVGAHGDGSSLLAGLAEEAPDAVVLDVRMPPTFTDEGVRTALEVQRRQAGNRGPAAEPVRRVGLRPGAVRGGRGRLRVSAQGPGAVTGRPRRCAAPAARRRDRARSRDRRGPGERAP